MRRIVVYTTYVQGLFEFGTDWEWSVDGKTSAVQMSKSAF